jgi:hypothetical protein
MTAPTRAIEWARAEAARLYAEIESPSPGSEYPSAQTTTAAVEFLRTQAGTESYFYEKAFEEARGQFNELAVRGVARVLENWADYAEQGMVDVLPFEALFRQEAATDLMEQVQILLDDPTIHPAAPVMLGGAALEEQLRALATARGISIPGRSTIDSLAGALRSNDIISRQQKKDIDSWGGLRNAAAHGRFDEIERPHAQLIAQGVNLFLAQTSAST